MLTRKKPLFAYIYITIIIACVIGYYAYNHNTKTTYNERHLGASNNANGSNNTCEGMTLTYMSIMTQAPYSCIGALANEPLWIRHKFLQELDDPGISFMWSESEGDYSPVSERYDKECIVIIANGLYGGQVGIGFISPITGVCDIGYPYSDVGMWERWLAKPDAPTIEEKRVQSALSAFVMAENKAYKEKRRYLLTGALEIYGFGGSAIDEIKDTVLNMTGSPLFPPSTAIDEPSVQLLLTSQDQGYVLLVQKHRTPFYSLPIKRNYQYSEASFSVGYDAIIILSPGMFKMAILRPDLFPRAEDQISVKLMAEKDNVQVLNELWTQYVRDMNRIYELKLSE